MACVYMTEQRTFIVKRFCQSCSSHRILDGHYRNRFQEKQPLASVFNRSTQGVHGSDV